jgi:hypothetical protein
MRVKKSRGNALARKIDAGCILAGEILPDGNNPVILDEDVAREGIRTRSVIDAAVLQQCLHMSKLLPF